MKLFTIIYSPTIDFDFMQQRPQRIMEQFARHGHQVYFLNITQEPGKPMKEIEPNLFVLYDHKEIYTAPRNYPVVLYMSWAATQGWISLIKPDIALYDCLDDFEQWRALETQIVGKVQLVLTTAEHLYEKMTTMHDNVVMVKNGCEYEHFCNVAASPYPADWPRTYGPVIGYVGALGSWMDHELVEKIANEYHIVLIGPEFGMPQIQHANIHRMGIRHYKTLPTYLNRMDVLIIPFAINDITLSTNPIKMYEYLATGKPVITTAMPETKLIPEVFCADTHDQFMDMLSWATHGSLNGSDLVGQRQRVAQANSWRSRYQAIHDALIKL